MKNIKVQERLPRRTKFAKPVWIEENAFDENSVCDVCERSVDWMNEVWIGHPDLNDMEQTPVMTTCESNRCRETAQKKAEQRLTNS